MVQSRAMARRLITAVLISVAAIAVPATASGDLQSGIASSRSHERALQGSIAGDTSKIEGLQGKLTDVAQRLAAIQATLDSERTQLVQIRDDLRSSRAHLAILRAQYKQGMEALAAQLVADYESARPDAVSVIFSAHGWSDMLDRVNGLKRIQDQNVRAIRSVREQRGRVSAETTHLRGLVARQQRITTASFIQRTQIAQIRNAVVNRELHFKRARANKASALGSIQQRRKALERRLTKLTQSSGGFLAHGGESGFFPAPGTDYTYGSEPELAARLDRLGRALGIHLIGLSGHRTPQHSVEVGGFPNDPHTRGEASDTPGIEGVSEATLNQYGLTRPFGGAAEADHIQLH